MRYTYILYLSLSELTSELNMPYVLAELGLIFKKQLVTNYLLLSGDMIYSYSYVLMSENVI